MIAGLVDAYPLSCFRVSRLYLRYTSGKSAPTTNTYTHGDCGQGKRLDARPFVSASPIKNSPQPCWSNPKGNCVAGALTTVPVKRPDAMNRSPVLDSWGQQPKRMGTVQRVSAVAGELNTHCLM